MLPIYIESCEPSPCATFTANANLVLLDSLAAQLTLSGDKPSGEVLFQLPAFAGNIAHASAGTVDNKTGTVTLAPTVRSVTVQLTHPEAG